MRGRRIPVEDNLDPITALLCAGDYYGPVSGYTGAVPAVFFLLPNAFLPDAQPGQSSVHHVCSPPHVFRECADGSLEIRESIGARGGGLDNRDEFVWHGYLDEGHEWRTV